MRTPRSGPPMPAVSSAVSDPASANIVWSHAALSRDERWKLLRTRGGTVWMTGLSGSGKSTIATALESELLRRGRMAYRLDGDNIRHGLNANLGFSADDRRENIRRVGEVARLFADAGAIAIVSFISPYRADRELVRRVHAASSLTFVEAFIDTPLEVCEQRDPKGLYRKARAGEIKGFTGIDDPYEAPAPGEAELVIKTAEHDVAGCVQQCLHELSRRGMV